MKVKDADATWKRAVVSKVFDQKGYVLAFFKGGEYSEKDVTFNLKCWQDKSSNPSPGQMVELTKVRLFAGGWRANLARPITLEEQG